MNFINWKVYNELNPDLKLAGLNTKSQIIQHWIKYGSKEKRKSLVTDLTSDFSWYEYRKLNPQLVQCKTQTDYEVHWIRYGRKEKLKYKKTSINSQMNSPVNSSIDIPKHPSEYFDFKWKSYQLLNPDLSEAGLCTKEELYNHWITHGIKENRLYNVCQISPTFDWREYRRLNKSLDHLQTQSEYELHWIKKGILDESFKNNNINMTPIKSKCIIFISYNSGVTIFAAAICLINFGFIKLNEIDLIFLWEIFSLIFFLLVLIH